MDGILRPSTLLLILLIIGAVVGVYVAKRSIKIVTAVALPLLLIVLVYLFVAPHVPEWGSITWANPGTILDAVIASMELVMRWLFTQVVPAAIDRIPDIIDAIGRLFTDASRAN